MLCPRCGKEIQDGVKFCRFCGAKVAGEVETNVDKSLNVKPENDHVETIVKHEHNSRKNWLILTVILLVIAIIATVVILYLLFRPVGDAADKKNVNMNAAPAASELTATAAPSAAEQQVTAAPSAAEQQVTAAPSAAEQPATADPSVAEQPATASPSMAEQAMTARQNEERSAEQSVLTYDNGDTVYLPTQESIAYDETENVIYYNDILVVYLLSDISQEEAAALAESVNGTVVGDISGSVNVLQIKVSASDLTQLNNYADTLMASEDVLYATYDMPLPVTTDATADGNPWSDDPDNPQKDRANEDWPDGNDWWAEAIGAYTAWDYVDSGVELAPVTVGIIDNGFEDTHPEFDGRMTVRGSNEIDVDKNGSRSSHGTHVAGIIGAANNEQGIRGVADNADMICVDYSVKDERGNDVDLVLGTGEYVEITKQLIESGVCVINNSWGIPFMSEEEFVNDLYKDQDYNYCLEWLVVEFMGTYDKYLDYLDLLSRRTGLECAIMMAQLLLNGADEFIIVGTAGNDGIDAATYHGFYSAITREGTDLITNNRYISEASITYETIKNHILIVGAVENRRGDKDGYYMTSYSNFGETVDICAPGGKYEKKDESSQIFSTVLDNQYGYSFGTSMAAPMVSGAAALLWSIDPTLSAAKVREYLCEDTPHKAVRTGTEESHPMLNVGAAVEALLKDKSSAVKPTNDKVLRAVNAYDENGELVEAIHFDYDEDGLISRSYHDSYWNGNPSDGGYDYIYTYDEAGRLISRFYYVDMWGDGFDDVIRSYDSNGLLVSDNMYSEGEVSVEKEYAYDEGGRLIWERAINGSPFLGGKVENEYSYSYHTDEQNQTVGVRHNETDPSVEDTEVIYNAASQLIQGYKSELTYGTDGKTIYEYLDDPYFCIRDEFSTFSHPYDIEETRSTNTRYAIILDSAGQEIESFMLGSPEAVKMSYDEDGYLIRVDNIENTYYIRCEFIYGEPGEELETVDEEQQSRQELPPLSYEERTEHYDHVTSHGILTGTSDLAYPYFTDGSTIAARLNEYINDAVDDLRGTTVDTGEEFEDYEADAEEATDQGLHPGWNNMEISVLYNDNGLISLLYKSEDYYGSLQAHPVTLFKGHVYDIGTCKELDYRDLAGSKYWQMSACYTREATAQGVSSSLDKAETYVLSAEGLRFYCNVGEAVPRKIIIVPFTSDYFDRAPVDSKTTDSEDADLILTQEEAYALAVGSSGYEDGETYTKNGTEYVIELWDCGRSGYNGRSVYVYQIRELMKIDGPQMTQLVETVLVDAITGECTVIPPFESLALDDDPLSDSSVSNSSAAENESSDQQSHLTLTVTGNAVNIRSGPGTNYASLGKVNKGDKLFSIGKSDNWYQVEYGNGTGYIIEDYVTIGTGGFYTAVDSGTLSVNGNDVNIRSGPGTEYQSIGSVSRGTTLTITGKSDNWYQVSYNGGTGYIIEDYVIRN